MAEVVSLIEDDTGGVRVPEPEGTSVDKEYPVVEEEETAGSEYVTDPEGDSDSDGEDEDSVADGEAVDSEYVEDPGCT